MRKMSIYTILFALAVALCSLSMGCAALRQASYKEDYIHQQMQNYAYHTSMDNLWSAARTLLFKHGYYVREGRHGYQMETDWAIGDRSTVLRRYLVTGYQNADGSNSIHFDYYEEIQNPGNPPYTRSDRDYELEYELLRMIDSQSWAQVENAAESYASQKAN